MKKKILSLILVILVLFSSCTSSIDDYIEPPKLTDEQKELFDTLSADKGNFTLKYPKSGDYRSAFVSENFDGDGENEVLVFYEQAEYDAGEGNISGGTMYAAVIDRDNQGEWKTIYEIPIPGMDIESVVFTPLGKSRKNDIVISYSANTPVKHAMFLEYDGKKLSRLFESEYLLLSIGDFFDTGENLAFLVVKDIQSGGVIGETVSFEADKSVISKTKNKNSENQLRTKVIGTAYVSPMVDGYDSLTTGEILSEDKGKKTKALFLNCLRTGKNDGGFFGEGERYYTTDILYFSPVSSENEASDIPETSGVISKDNSGSVYDEVQEKPEIKQEMLCIQSDHPQYLKYTARRDAGEKFNIPFDVDGDGIWEFFEEKEFPHYEISDRPYGQIGETADESDFSDMSDDGFGNMSDTTENQEMNGFSDEELSSELQEPDFYAYIMSNFQSGFDYLDNPGFINRRYVCFDKKNSFLTVFPSTWQNTVIPIRLPDDSVIFIENSKFYDKPTEILEKGDFIIQIKISENGEKPSSDSSIKAEDFIPVANRGNAVCYARVTAEKNSLKPIDIDFFNMFKFIE